MLAEQPTPLRIDGPRPDCDASLVAAAYGYLERRWSCIPLIGKQPALARWKAYQSARPTRDEVAEWFAQPSLRPTGVGVVTGKISGLVVVDCETPEDAAYWLGKFPASPLASATGGGGVHVYYQFPADALVRNRVKLFGRPIDVRAEGGYVAAPPSRHPSGRRYAWADAGVDLATPLPIFDPAWMAEPEHCPVPRSDRYAAELRNVVAYIRRIRATAGQGGHNATFRAACKLRDAGLAEAEALAILARWNETNASPPWTEAELAHKIRSAFDALTR